MTDQNQKPERFRFDTTNGKNRMTISDDIYPILVGMAAISAQLDYLITMVYGQKQEEHFAPEKIIGAEYELEREEHHDRTET